MLISLHEVSNAIDTHRPQNSLSRGIRMHATNAHASTHAPAPLAMTRLGVMMFLEFFLWGAWAVPMGKYLATVFADRADVSGIIGQAYSTGSIAAIVAPLFVGLWPTASCPARWCSAGSI